MHKFNHNACLKFSLMHIKLWIGKLRIKKVFNRWNVMVGSLAWEWFWREAVKQWGVHRFGLDQPCKLWSRQSFTTLAALDNASAIQFINVGLSQACPNNKWISPAWLFDTSLVNLCSMSWKYEAGVDAGLLQSKLLPISRPQLTNDSSCSRW